MSERPIVLYACVRNSGRSVAAKVLTEHYAGDRIEVRSAGSDPGQGINPLVEQALAERGLSAAAEFPRQLDPETVRTSDIVITMGCGESCPYLPRKRCEDWVIDDPAGQDIDTVRRIVDDVDTRVRGLVDELTNRG